MDSFRQFAQLASLFVLPLLIVLIPLYGLIRRVAVYEEFVEGAKEGFQVAVRIIPYLVAILFAVGMFRASGAMDALISALRPALAFIGVPPEIVPMAIVRPLTGSGSVGILTVGVNCASAASPRHSPSSARSDSSCSRSSASDSTARSTSRMRSGASSPSRKPDSSSDSIGFMSSPLA